MSAFTIQHADGSTSQIDASSLVEAFSAEDAVGAWPTPVATSMPTVTAPDGTPWVLAIGADGGQEWRAVAPEPVDTALDHVELPPTTGELP